MVRHTLKIAACIAIIIGCLSVEKAAAQSPATFGAGLSLMTDEGTGAGFALNVSKELTSGGIGVGPVGDFSLHHDNGVTWTVFSGGVRATGHPADTKIAPFGEFLVGASVLSGGLSSDGHLSFVYGGGVHVPLNDRVTLLFQFDLVTVHVSDFTTETGKRTTFGISIPLGSR